jgi:hypothetical protein
MVNDPYTTNFTFGYGTVQPKPDIPPKPRIAFEGCPLCRSANTAGLRTADCSTHPLYHPWSRVS